MDHSSGPPPGKPNPLPSSPSPLSVLARLAMTALVGLIVAAMGPNDGMVSVHALDGRASGRSSDGTVVPSEGPYR